MTRRKYKGYIIKKNYACGIYEIRTVNGKAYTTLDGKHIGAIKIFPRLKDAKEFIDNNDFNGIIFL